MLCTIVLTIVFSSSSQTIDDCKWKPHENATSDGKKSYLGAQLWQVIIDSQEKLNTVDGLEIIEYLQNWGPAYNTPYYDVFVEFTWIESVKKEFENNNIEYEVTINDFKKLIDEENQQVVQNLEGHNLTWEKYHRLEDIESFVDYLATRYTSICNVVTIGQSIEGRLLKVLKVSSGRSNNTAVWIDGGIHAREWISPATVTYVIQQLVDNWINEDTAVRNIDWHFLPVLNPDGYEFAHTHDRLWRKNRRQNGTCPGTDLNRNFENNWGGLGSSACPCHDVYAGAKPFSEPETASVRDYIIQHKSSWKGFLSFHSYGQIIFHAGGDELKNIGDKMANEMKAVYGTFYEVESSESDPTGGDSDNWANKIVGIKYAYTFELRDLGKYGFVLPASNIKPSGKEALAAVRLLANVINN
ncbi:hypothetical protein FQR65_LT01406 [Abscondita terminalis]|nr:hypothetical protein FQR65_LT01406 [Abscondita terminalis]